MSGHFALVFAVAFAAAVASFVSYDGGKSVTMRGAISIVLLLSVSQPIMAFAKELSELRAPTFSGFDGEEVGEYEEVAKDAFSEGVCKLIAEEYSLSEKNISVKAEGFDVKSMTAEKIYVTLYGKAAFLDPRAVEKFINNYGFGVCYAEIGI